MENLHLLSDEELRNQLHLRTKLIIYKAASSGKRLAIERMFENDLQRSFSAIYKAASKYLVSSGFLDLAFNQSVRLKSISGNAAAIRKGATEILNIGLRPLALYVSKASERYPIISTYQKWVSLGFDLGAVTGLRAMGFSATAESVDEVSTKSIVQKALKFPLVFELTDAAIIDALQSRSILFGEGLTEAIIQEIRDIIRDKIFLGNSSVYSTALDIAGARGLPAWRAEKIVRTETQAAFNLALYRMYERSGIGKHYWVTVGDNRVRPSHADNEAAGSIVIGTPFPNGALHPGDGPDSINCRCSIEPDLSDPNMLLDPWDGSEGEFLGSDLFGGPYSFGVQSIASPSVVYGEIRDTLREILQDKDFQDIEIKKVLDQLDRAGLDRLDAVSLESVSKPMAKKLLTREFGIDWKKKPTGMLPPIEPPFPKLMTGTLV